MKGVKVGRREDEGGSRREGKLGEEDGVICLCFV